MEITSEVGSGSVCSLDPPLRAAGAGPGILQAHSGTEIVLGALAGRTGRGATYGAGMAQGARMAVADDASNPARSAIADQAGVPYVVVGATHPSITRDRDKWTLRVIQSGAAMAKDLARVVVRGLGLRRIAVISDSND